MHLPGPRLHITIPNVLKSGNGIAAVVSRSNFQASFVKIRLIDTQNRHQSLPSLTNEGSFFVIFLDQGKLDHILMHFMETCLFS